MEDLAEKFVCLQEGIKVASNNDLIFGKVLLQSQQIFLQVLDLHLIFFRAWTEMDTSEDEVVGTSKGHAFCPSEIFLLLRVDLFRDLWKVLELGEAVSVDENKWVFFGISHDVLVRFPQLV